jgi:chaperonin cofactor prefoldin
MDMITGRDWVIIIFGAGGVISTISYVLSAVKDIKVKIESADNRVHDLEIGFAKMETKFEGLINEIRRNNRQNNSND